MGSWSFEKGPLSKGMLAEDGARGPTSGRQSSRMKGIDQMNSWQTEECLNPVRGIRDWQKRFLPSLNLQLV